MPTYKTISHYVPSDLVAGDYPIVTKSVTIKKGQSLSKGSVLGKVKADGKYILSKAKATDGSQMPNVVLAEPIDAKDDDVEAVVYLSGQFASNKLVFGKEHDTDSTFDTLRSLNIYLTNTF